MLRGPHALCGVPGGSAAEWMDTIATDGAAGDLVTAYVRTTTYTSGLDELPASGRADGPRSQLDLAQAGWRDEVIHARYLPRMTVVEHLGQRPPVTGSGRPDVLLTGDWIGGEGWLADAALASGAEAGRRAAAALPQPLASHPSAA